MDHHSEDILSVLFSRGGGGARGNRRSKVGRDTGLHGNAVSGLPHRRTLYLHWQQGLDFWEEVEACPEGEASPPVPGRGVPAAVVDRGGVDTTSGPQGAPVASGTVTKDTLRCARGPPGRTRGQVENGKNSVGRGPVGSRGGVGGPSEGSGRVGTTTW